MANMLIFHTVANQTKAINKLKDQEIDIPIERLSGIAPYWTEHISRFGMFNLNMEKTMADVEYDLKT